MFVGLLLIGSVVGAVSGLSAAILGYSIWMALAIYSGVGALSVLAGALAAIVLPGADHKTKAATPRDLSPVHRG